VGEVGDGALLAVAEAGEQGQAGLVAERGEERSVAVNAGRGLGVLGDIGLDVAHLCDPATTVFEEGFRAASGGDVFEAGLYDAEEGSGGRGG